VTERAERKGALPNKLGQRTDDGVLLTEACAEPRTNALRRVFLTFVSACLQCAQ
jgi:hypothetical protein